MLGKVAIGSPDFNGDGFSDVFRITGDGVLYHLRGDGKGLLADPRDSGRERMGRVRQS